MSSPCVCGGGHGPGTAGGDSHATQLMFFQMLTPAEEPPEMKLSLRVGSYFSVLAVSGMERRTSDGDTALCLIWLDLLQLNVHQAYPHRVPESAPRKS